MENKSNSIEIVFDDNKKVFESGDDVTGAVKFDLKGLTSVTDIKILVICESEVKWTDIPVILIDHQGSMYSVPVNNNFHQKLTLLKLNNTRVPEECKAHNSQNVCKDSHEVNFKFQLPKIGIPSTFSGPHGYIKYYIEVTNEDPKVEDNRLSLREFKVNAPIRENLSLSIGCSKEKDFGLLSFGSGKIIVHASLSKKGWAPGTPLELHLTIENQSSVEATPRATLYQTQVYTCERSQKAIQRQISDPIVGTKVDKHKNLSQLLFIPIPKEESLTIKSELISVKYFVHVTLDIPHATDINVNIPVVITSEHISADPIHIQY